MYLQGRKGSVEKYIIISMLSVYDPYGKSFISFARDTT